MERVQLNGYIIIRDWFRNVSHASNPSLGKPSSPTVKKFFFCKSQFKKSKQLIYVLPCVP